MRFWDTSALVPLLTEEATTDRLEAEYALDRELIVSFITPVEVSSAITRKAGINADLRRQAHRRYAILETTWSIVDKYAEAIAEAERMISRYHLRAGDAIQLACALIAGRTVRNLSFVTLDTELVAAAKAEGFPVLP